MRKSVFYLLTVVSTLVIVTNAVIKKANARNVNSYTVENITDPTLESLSKALETNPCLVYGVIDDENYTGIGNQDCLMLEKIDSQNVYLLDAGNQSITMSREQFVGKWESMELVYQTKPVFIYGLLYENENEFFYEGEMYKGINGLNRLMLKGVSEKNVYLADWDNRILVIHKEKFLIEWRFGMEEAVPIDKYFVYGLLERLTIK